MAEHISGCPARLPDAEGVPRVGVGKIGIDLIAVEREVDQLALFVVQRDVEVVRVHQLADDLVDLGVERRHVLGCARRLGDAIQGGLDLRSVLVRSLAGLELLDLLVGSHQFVGSDRDEGFFSSRTAPHEDRDQGHSGFPSGNSLLAPRAAATDHCARIDDLPSMSAWRHGGFRLLQSPPAKRPDQWAWWELSDNSSTSDAATRCAPDASTASDSGMAMTVSPAIRAAAMPTAESSSATASAGATPSCRHASR